MSVTGAWACETDICGVAASDSGSSLVMLGQEGDFRPSTPEPAKAGCYERCPRCC
jgi:hypothetical protein